MTAAVGGAPPQSVSPAGGEERTNDEMEEEENYLYSPRFICVMLHAFILGGEPRGGGYKSLVLSTKMCCTFAEELPVTCPLSSVRDQAHGERCGPCGGSPWGSVLGCSTGASYMALLPSAFRRRLNTVWG